jgi:hypothetical protein
MIAEIDLMFARPVMVCETEALRPLAMVERSYQVMGCVAANCQAKYPNVAALIPAPPDGGVDCCFSPPPSLLDPFDEPTPAVKRVGSREGMKLVKSYVGYVTVEGFRSRSASESMLSPETTRRRFSEPRYPSQWTRDDAR